MSAIFLEATEGLNETDSFAVALEARPDHASHFSAPNFQHTATSCPCQCCAPDSVALADRSFPNVEIPRRNAAITPAY